eukprot:164992-Chlamydomonas_euryale.AAC.1
MGSGALRLRNILLALPTRVQGVTASFPHPTTPPAHNTEKPSSAPEHDHCTSTPDSTAPCPTPKDSTPSPPFPHTWARREASDHPKPSTPRLQPTLATDLKTPHLANLSHTRAHTCQHDTRAEEHGRQRREGLCTSETSALDLARDAASMIFAQRPKLDVVLSPRRKPAPWTGAGTDGLGGAGGRGRAWAS